MLAKGIDIGLRTHIGEQQMTAATEHSRRLCQETGHGSVAVARFQIEDRVEELRRKGKILCVALNERKLFLAVAAAAEPHRFAAEIDAYHRAKMQVFLDECGSSPTPAADFQNVLPAKIHSAGHPIVELYRIAVCLVHCFQLEGGSA